MLSSVNTWNQGSSKQGIKLAWYSSNILSILYVPHQVSLVIYIAAPEHFYFIYFLFCWLICCWSHSSAPGIWHRQNTQSGWACCCFHLSMIDVITVILLNPANPAAEPDCPNWVCWMLPGRRSGEDSGETSEVNRSWWRLLRCSKVEHHPIHSVRNG